MIQAMLTFQFLLGKEDVREIFPHFHPIELLYQEENEEKDYSKLITEKDVYAIFYQHTTGLFRDMGEHTNFYIGYLNDTPYQVLSSFIQVESGSQYLSISLFESEDDVEFYEKMIREATKKLNQLFISFDKAKITKQTSLLSNIKIKITEVLKFAFFQLDRLSNLDKLQKSALIFISDERIKILEYLREGPISKQELKRKISHIKENVKIETLMEPFLDLNLARSEWIKGERDRKTGRIKHQGEYFFLIKDVMLARVPNLSLVTQLKKIKPELAPKFEQRLKNYFQVYDPKEENREEIKDIASLLLDPDFYDSYALMKNRFYPIEKIPKIFSEFADKEQIINKLKETYVLTEIKDDNKKSWILLLADIKPIIFFPEYLLPRIRNLYKTSDEEKKITYEIAQKAHDLLEISFPEEIEF